MAPIKFGVGQSVLRKEDDALIRGKGRYTDDHAPAAMMHALVLRSPHAHAKFTIDATRARSLPGVAAILTADDTKDLGGLPCLFNLEVDPFTGPPYAILAHGVVRHVGDAVAFVVAETVDRARDAVEAIEVNWTPLPAVIGVVNAVKKGAPQVWPEHAGNVLFDVPIGDKKATEAAFAKAHAVAEISIVNPRIVTNFMETRAVVCEYDAKRDHLTLTVGSQGSHRLRDILCQNVLKDSGRKDAGDLSGCRRRFRHQTVSLPRICAGRGRRAQTAQDGQMDGRPRRSLHGRRPGPRQRHHRPHGARRRRQVLGDGCRPDGRYGRVSVDIRSLHPARRRRHAARALRYPGIPLPGPNGIHQHGAGRCLSRRRASRGRLCGRASCRRVRAKAWDDAGCDPAQELHFAARDALQDRHRQGLQFRRLHRAYEASDGDRELEGISKARQGGQEAGSRSRHRTWHLRRSLRHHGRGDRQCGARSQRRRHDSDRHAVERAGASDRLCANRRRAVRASARARPHFSGRHRPDRRRPRHRRLGIDPDRRRQRRARHPHAWCEYARDRGGRTGDQRCRSRDQRRHRADRRHRPLDYVCRSCQSGRASIRQS